MLEIGWGKIVIIGIVALIVIGPKELPAVLRMLGQWMTKLRRMASEFQSQFQEAMREAEMADLKKQVDEITGKAQSYTNFDPLRDVPSGLETSARAIDQGKPAEPVADSTAAASSKLSVPTEAAPVASETALAGSDAKVVAPTNADRSPDETSPTTINGGRLQDKPT